MGGYRDRYIDIIEKAVGAYTEERMQAYIDAVLKDGLSEPGFCRLTANIGTLLAHGRRLELKDTFVKMMDLCCEQIPTALANYPEVGNEFSVRDIVPCILLIEEKQVFPKEKTDQWRQQLKRIQVETTYHVIAKDENDKVMNWAAYGAVGEQTRKYAGLAAEDEFINKQIASQLWSFDENGMYRDPDEPAVYDIATRFQLSSALHFGYDGAYRDKLDELLIKGGMCTLYLQSVTGEIPYGGRSNQFLHNEAMLAGVLEYEASRYYKQGNLELAGKFKAAAVLAQETILRNLDVEELHHIKNNYPQDSMYGCEWYAYFDKYMVTVGSFCYQAYQFADDRIRPTSCPAMDENYIYRTSEHFHRTMLKYGKYFVQYDTDADFHYDANGLGRIHRKGAPSPICLSVPFPVKPSYILDMENEVPMSICWGVMSGDAYAYSSEKGTEYVLLEKSESETEVSVRWRCRLAGGQEAVETCVVKEDGVRLSIRPITEECSGDDHGAAAGSESGGQKLCWVLPAFAFDGKHETVISENGNQLCIQYDGWQCVYTVSGELKDTGKVLANRNGHYRAYMAEGEGCLEVAIEITKIGA